MNENFHTLDYVIFIVYALLILGVGLWVSRDKKGHQKNAEDYFLASKSLPWWAIGASLIAANISAEQFIGMSGSGFASGLAIASYEWMAAITLVVVAFVFLPTFLKSGIYTIPEISSIGKNEKELTQAKIPYEVGKAFFKGMARAQISHEPVGMLKILFHRETLEILGVHCFGYQASEIVHIGQAIMNQKGEANSIKYFVNTTFNYPTMAEAYRVAAFDGLNRLF